MSEEFISKEFFISERESKTADDYDEGEYYNIPGVIYKYETEPGICGLANLGNTCFMNSALQCLANLPQLVEYFISGRYHCQINRSNEKTKGGAVAKEFGKLIQQMWSGKYCSLTPSDFRNEIIELAPDFKGYHQQDTQEFTMFLLDGLHDDLNGAKKEKSLMNAELAHDTPINQVADAAWRKYKSDNDSIITDLMHGQLKSTLICTNCRKESVTFDPFCHLSLPLPSEEKTGWFSNGPQEKKEVTIAQCLIDFTKPEEIERNCENCGLKSSQRILNIWRLPEILVIHLKRYQFVNTSMYKIGTKVYFYLKNFKLDDAVANPEEKNQYYELISVILHSGTLSNGHYIAYVLKSQWYAISDKTTSKEDIHEDPVGSDDVYMLYYQKIPHPTPNESSLRDAGNDRASNGVDDFKEQEDNNDVKRFKKDPVSQCSHS